MINSKKIFIILFLIIMFCTKAFGAEYFNYKKFILNERVLYNLSEDGRVQSDLVLFSRNFLEGIETLDSGDYHSSEKFFQTAVKVWPEYFDTYFILALIYEKQGKYAAAARYYKTYLNGLKKYSKGEYLISGQIIDRLSVRHIEYYEYAYEEISKRLASYNIDIDKVSPATKFPVFLIPFGVLIFGPIGYYLYILIKRYLRKKDIKRRMSEGFWMCGKCNAVNPDLSIECSKCGNKRE